MTFSAVLLAGGQSRRMGRDKATLEFMGEPLWQRQMRLLRELQPQQLLVSSRTQPLWIPNDQEFVADGAVSRGPISGIAAALKRTGASHLVVLAVDMPFIELDDLQQLARHASADKGVVPVIDGCFQPVSAIYSREAQSEFETASLSSDTSLQRLVRLLVAQGKTALVNIDPSKASHYRSINTPDDL